MATVMININNKALCASTQQLHIASCNNNNNNNNAAATATYVVYQPLFHFILASHDSNSNKNTAATTTYVVDLALMHFIPHCIKHQQALRPRARARNTIISCRAMATTMSAKLPISYGPMRDGNGDAYPSRGR
jgi:hypothetical protein